MKRFFCFGPFHARQSYFWTAFCVLVLLLSSCKSKPLPIEEPLPSIDLSLVFESIEADDPSLLHLLFTLNIGIPFPLAGQAGIESWQVEINGQKAGSGFALDCGGSEAFPLAPGPNAFPLLLDMDVAALAAQGLAPADDYEVNLTATLAFSRAAPDSPPPARIEVSGLAVFPGLRPPAFNITSIAILKAELINTRFRVGLKIDNPNPFPVELSSFSYELYGNGRLWADGIEKNILKVNRKSSLEGNLFLIMNFINMKRDLLDQVINLIDVNYRFAGEAQVISGVEYLPKFKTEFDLSGYSQVFDN